MVLASLETLRLEPGSRMASLNFGSLVSGETARRIACDAAITPVLTGPEGEILAVGRKRRAVPAATRRALDLRDGCCQWAGCTVPARECQPHHLRHVVDGGSNKLPNLQLYCSVHHPLFHPENSRYRRAREGRAP
jgi:hypothetical protein